MKTEYVIWGKSSKNPIHENVLVSEIDTLSQANKIQKVLIDKHGCFDTRLQRIDFKQDINNMFIDSINI
jgi:hypothetical protein